MKRLLINGSPRGKKSNTTIILSWVAEAIAEAEKDVPSSEGIPVIYLAKTKDISAHKKALLEADEIIFAMPLYTDAMPGIVKNFIDSLADIPKKKLASKRAAFIVQSGFPESIHSETLALYLERLALRLEWIYGGTIIKGGMEGIHLYPDKMVSRIKKNFCRAAMGLVHNGCFDPAIVSKMARPHRLGIFARAIITLSKPFGIMNFYWNKMLRENDAYAKRFDAPYGKAFGKK